MPRYSEEARERAKLEKQLAAANNASQTGGRGANPAAAAAAVAEMTSLNAQLERRAVRAEVGGCTSRMQLHAVYP